MFDDLARVARQTKVTRSNHTNPATNMSKGIPLIQPSSTALNTNAAAAKRSIFSAPTVDLNPNPNHGIALDMDRDQNDEEYVAVLHLDPSPIKKGVSTDSWAKTNRTLRSTFRPTTNEIAVYVAGRKAAEEVQYGSHHSITVKYGNTGPDSIAFRDRRSNLTRQVTS